MINLVKLYEVFSSVAEDKKENGTTSPKLVRPSVNRPKPPPKLAPKPGLKPVAPNKPVPAARTSFGNGGRISGNSFCFYNG